LTFKIRTMTMTIRNIIRWDDDDHELYVDDHALYVDEKENSMTVNV